jgi:hypothetical protein
MSSDDYILTPNGKKVHKNSLSNLKRITSETARANQLKSAASRSLNNKLAEDFKITAKAFQTALKDLPQLSSLDIMRMAMMKALSEDNYDDAARYAAQIAEYENPKLARIEQTNTNKISDLTDDDLYRIIHQEGLTKHSLQ